MCLAMSVGYEVPWIQIWRKRTQCNNTCDNKINIGPEVECTHFILFSNIIVLICYNHSQYIYYIYLGKVTSEECSKSEF